MREEAFGSARVLVDATPLAGSTALHGIGRVVQDLLHGLAAIRGEWAGSLDIEALVSFRPGAPRAVTGDLAAAAAALACGPRAWDDAVAAGRFLGLPLAARRAGASLVHLPQARGVPLAMPVPVVVTCHDLIPLRFPEQYLGSRTARASRLLRDMHRYRSAARVVAISDNARRDLAMVRVPEDRVDVVPNGVDLGGWSPGAATCDDDDDARRRRAGLGARPYVLYVGDCDFRRNVRNMVLALGEARRTLDVELAWAGALSNRVAAMRRETRGLAAMAHVRFLGFVPDDDLAALYRGAVALTFLSRYEGFGLPVVEAMAAGCPVVVSRGSGCDALAGDAAMVVDPDDPAAAAACIARLHGDPGERARRVALGLERAQRFDRTVMARGYLDVYRRVLANAPARTAS